MLMLRARSFRMPGPVPADQQVPLMQTSGLSVGMPSSRDSADTKLVLRGLACSPLHSVSFSISGPPASDRSVARPAHGAGADESRLPFQTDWIDFVDVFNYPRSRIIGRRVYPAASSAGRTDSPFEGVRSANRAERR